MIDVIMFKIGGLKLFIEYDDEGNILNKESFLIPFLSEEDFLRQIEYWRKEKKYSYEFLGKILGLHQTTVSLMFQGKRGLTINKLVMLLRIFGWRLSIQEIIDSYPEGYEPDEEDYREADSYELIQQYIKDYKGGFFKGTYEEYLKTVMD